MRTRLIAASLVASLLLVGVFSYRRYQVPDQTPKRTENLREKIGMMQRRTQLQQPSSNDAEELLEKIGMMQKELDEKQKEIDELRNAHHEIGIRLLNEMPFQHKQLDDPKFDGGFDGIQWERCRVTP